MWHSLTLYLSLCVCVRVFFFCKTSVKIGCFGSCATSISELCVLSTMVRLQMFNKIACVKQSTFLSAPRHRSSADLTLCLTPVVVIYLKMSRTTELLIANEMLAAKFSEPCILNYFDTMTTFPNTVKHQTSATQDKTRRQISYLLVRQRVTGQVGQQITFCVRIARPVSSLFA